MNCSAPDCRVSYWRGVVSRGYRDEQGHQVARDDKDARLALAGAELVCRAFHEGPK